jgi:hypothetical protein
MVYADAGSLRELQSQWRCFDRVDAHPYRIPGGDAQADPAGDASLPVFEPARVVS